MSVSERVIHRPLSSIGDYSSGFPRRRRRKRLEPPNYRDFLDWRAGPNQDASRLVSRRVRPVTICIAAICQFPGDHLGGPYAVIAACDRMMTTEDIQFEPPQSKVFEFASNVVALVAGETDAQIEVCNHTFRELTESLPQSVEAIVDVYCRQLAAYNQRQAERTILAPFGLTFKSFLDHQQPIDPEISDHLFRKIDREGAKVATLIIGTDAYGPHIFKIYEDGRASCYDSIGFAAIGDGEWHADSQFMIAGHTANVPIGRALLLTYVAKKRAEVAPGVGKIDTDLIYILPGGPWRNFSDAIKDKLKTTYKKMEGLQNRAVQSASKDIDTFVKELTTPKEQPSPE